MCSIDGCEKPAFSRGWCVMHWTRWRRHGDPNVTFTHMRGPRGAKHPHWKGDDAKYIAVHQRIQRRRGRATDHACVDCGGPAKDWSYDGTDPNELYDERVQMAYSTDAARYEPRCASCHKVLDLPRRRGGLDRRFKYDQDLKAQLVTAVARHRMTGAEAAATLGCSRGYINKLVRESRWRAVCL